MKDRNFKSLSIVVENAIRQNKVVAQRLHELTVKQKWEEIVGPMFAKATTSIVIKNKLLMVSINSAAIRSELILNKSRIMERMNLEIGYPSISDILIR